MSVTMSTTEVAAEDSSDLPRSVVRSMRFRREHWEAIAEKARALRVDVSVFVRDAVLAACGVEDTEARRARHVADALDSVKKPISIEQLEEVAKTSKKSAKPATERTTERTKRR